MNRDLVDAFSVAAGLASCQLLRLVEGFVCTPTCKVGSDEGLSGDAAHTVGRRVPS